MEARNMTVIDHPVIRPREVFGNIKTPDHPCELCGRLCAGRRRRCMTCNVRIRRYRVRAAAIALLGGKAVCCGWIAKPAELAGYVFHHANGGKEFTIAGTTHKPWALIKSEVLKCELWCARCHCIHHSAYSDPKFLSIAGNAADPVMAALASRRRSAE
jgi:hypothetical protein